MKNKICIKCHKIKSISEFSKDKTRKNKLFVYCKDCCKKLSKKYTVKHKLEKREYDKNRYKKLRKKVLKAVKKYNKENREKIRKYKNEYQKQRKKVDINYKILQNLRKRIWDALKDNIKSKSTKQLIGCSQEFLKGYFEDKFTKYMTWDNYGKYWEIDHIRPCASFNLSKKSEQQKCFNYTNLQPLKTFDNQSKGTKIK